MKKEQSEKQEVLKSGEFKKLYGMEPEESLLAVDFATTENPYLSEQANEE